MRKELSFSGNGVTITRTIKTTVEADKNGEGEYRIIDQKLYRKDGTVIRTRTSVIRRLRGLPISRVRGSKKQEILHKYRNR